MKTAYFLMVALNASDGAVESAEVFDPTFAYERTECRRQAVNLMFLSEQLGGNQYFFCAVAEVTQ